MEEGRSVSLSVARMLGVRLAICARAVTASLTRSCRMTTSCCTSCIDARLRCRVPASKQCGRNAQTRLRTSRPWLSQTCDAPREASIPHPASGAQLFSGNRLARALAGFCALRACARVDAWRQAPRMSARQQGQRAGLVASPHAAYSWRPG